MDARRWDASDMRGVDAINRGLSKTGRGVSERYSTTIRLFGVNDSTGGKRTGQDDVTVN
jgi:hypothetical protein